LWGRGALHLGGSSNNACTFQFGFPRRVEPAGFRDALDALCAALGEGGGSKDAPRRRDQQDAKLDLVGWLPFGDRRSGKVVAFAQCATGDDWREKLTELQPHAFCWHWMIEPPALEPLRLFFCPHRVDMDHWPEAILKGGVLFDRCRVTSLAARLPNALRARCNEWSRYVVAERLRA
jgi:hypothetical protein